MSTVDDESHRRGRRMDVVVAGCEIGPGSVVGFAFDHEAAPRTVRLPELSNVVCHVGIVERKPGEDSLTCRWLPIKRLDPLDLRAIMAKHRTPDAVMFDMQVKLPVAPNPLGRWRSVNTFQIDEGHVLMSKPIWKLVAPEGIEYRLRVRFGWDPEAASIILGR